MKPTPCPLEHLGFSRSIKIGDETHVQTCLKMVPAVETTQDGTTLTYHSAGPTQEWTTVGIVYQRPEPSKPPQKDTSWPEVVVLVSMFCLVGYLGRRFF